MVSFGLCDPFKGMIAVFRRIAAVFAFHCDRIEVVIVDPIGAAKIAVVAQILLGMLLVVDRYISAEVDEVRLMLVRLALTALFTNAGIAARTAVLIILMLFFPAGGTFKAAAGADLVYRVGADTAVIMTFVGRFPEGVLPDILHISHAANPAAHACPMLLIRDRFPRKVYGGCGLPAADTPFCSCCSA